MKFFQKIIDKQIAKNMGTSVESMKQMVQDAKTVSENTQKSIADAKKPVDASDPKWEPIRGITLDRYAELSVYLAKNNIFITDEINEFVEANGVPKGAWMDVLNGWSVRIGQDVDVRIRYGVIYADLFSK